MFTDRILALADEIEQIPFAPWDEIVPSHWASYAAQWQGREKSFCMAGWGYTNDCGTSACIAGHAALKAYPEAILRGGRVYDRQTQEVLDYVVLAALNYLGLADDPVDVLLADQLFLAQHSPVPMEHITPAQAAKCLRWLAETGRVNWTYACSKD